MEWLISHIPIIMLLFFLSIFVGIAVIVFFPPNKERFKTYAALPLKEEDHDK